jgi:tetratricopeptide (TPR) repeat protein
MAANHHGRRLGRAGLLFFSGALSLLPCLAGAAAHASSPEPAPRHEATSAGQAISAPGTETSATREAGRPPAEENVPRVLPSNLDALRSPNLVQEKAKANAGAVRDYQREIDAARVLRRERDHTSAGRLLLGLLDEQMPPEFRRAVLFELAMVAQDENQLGRAQQILAQYLQLFPSDPTVPEVFLRQGLLYRQMGANNMAVSKFYAVMNSALGMQADQFDYYKRLVLQAQTEIADTYHQQGKYQDAIEFYKRILKQNAPDLNKPQIHFKYITCLVALGRHAEAVPECEAFLVAYPDEPENPELRFLCADSLRQLGRRRDSMLQVLRLLESQKGSVRSNPDGWTYWQQKAGNQIANEFYKDGDYLNALEIYNRMASLSTNLAWQVPVFYQIGLVHERLQQPAQALEKFDKILAREKEITSVAGEGGNSLTTVLEMTKWRRQNLGWQNRAEMAIQSLKLPPLTPSTNATTSLPRSTSPKKSL